MQIETGRFTLRLFRAQDAPWLAREIANPKVQVWLTSPPHPYTVADAQWFIETYSTNLHYRVIEEAGTPLGVISMSATGSKFDLGYWLKEAAWGIGAMTECATAFLNWHFAESAVDVSSGWIAGNAASRNVLTKLGFAPDGHKTAICHFRGEEVTVKKVRITAQGWRDRHG